jgi:hypothetical protein
VAAWRDAPTLAQTRPLRDVNRDLRRKLGDDGVAYCNIVLSGTPVFAADVREEITAINRDYGTRGLAQANLILIEGFAGTAVRAFLSTVNLIARTTAPVKIFSGRCDTERWLHEKMVAFDPSIQTTHVSRPFDEVLSAAPVAAE